MKTFTYYIDPGHGWIEVTDLDLERAELKLSDFSAQGRFVQRKVSGFVYLEEDCDAPQFLAAWEAKYGKPQLREVLLNDRSERGIK